MSQHRTRRQCTEHTHTQTHKQTETIGVDCSQLAGEQRALFVCVCLYITIDCQFDLILTKRDSRHQLAKWAAAATVLDDYPVHGHEFTARRHQFEVSHRVSVSVWLIDDRGAAERRRRRREREPVVVPGPEGKSSAASEASWASIGFPLITTRYPLSLSFSTLHCTCLLLDTGCIFPFPPSFREKKTESLLPVQSWMTTIGKGGGEEERRCCALAMTTVVAVAVACRRKKSHWPEDASSFSSFSATLRSPVSECLLPLRR